MTLSDLASLGSFVSGVAVVVTLVFLVLQMRQSNKNQRALMNADRALQVRDRLIYKGDPLRDSALRAGLAADPDIEPEDARQFIIDARVDFAAFHDQFLQNREGMLDESRWRTTRSAIEHFLCFPGYRAFYLMYREGPYVTPEFRKLADQLFEAGRSKSPSDPFEVWRTLAAQERAFTDAAKDGSKITAY